MKNVKSLLMFVPAGLLVVGCGEYKKSPSDDLDYLRQNAEVQNKPVETRYLPGPVVIKQERVSVEETKVDSSFIIISPDKKMTFTEGLTSTFKVTVRATLPGVQMKLAAKGLPEGATLTEIEEDIKDSNGQTLKRKTGVFNLTWTPSLYSIAQNESFQSYDVKLTAGADVAASANKENAEKINGLVNEKDITLLLFRNQEPPSGLKVEGLASQLNEGQLTTFTVTAKVPGIDGKSPQKPRLVVSYDGVSLTPGNNFLELDGSRYVVADLNKKDVEYIGDSVWKFTLVFDTKNISVQPQLAKNGTVMTNADGTRVRLNFKVYSPYGMSTPESLIQLKLMRAKSQAVETPAAETTPAETEK